MWICQERVNHWHCIGYGFSTAPREHHQRRPLIVFRYDKGLRIYRLSYLLTVNHQMTFNHVNIDGLITMNTFKAGIIRITYYFVR